MAPSLVDRIRQRNTVEQEPFAEQPSHGPQPGAGNPFSRAANDLAVEWETMLAARDNALEEVEHHRAEVTYLAARVDTLTRELAQRVSFFEMEIGQMTRRADRATDDATAIRAKLTVIAQAIRMVLDETLATAPIKREPEQVRERPVAQPPRNLSTVQRPAPKDFNDTPAEGLPVSEEDAEDARDLLNRLAPVALKR